MKKNQFKSYLAKSWKRKILSVVSLLLFYSYGTLALAQTNAITGCVVDADTEEPLIGVTVKILGTAQGTVTDISGNYAINVSNGATLEFSFVGYKTVTHAVGTKKQINVALRSQSYEIDDVVVIGYGTVKKSDLTGAVGSVSAKQLKDVTVTNPQLALQGRVPGVSGYTDRFFSKWRTRNTYTWYAFIPSHERSALCSGWNDAFYGVEFPRSG